MIIALEIPNSNARTFKTKIGFLRREGVEKKNSANSIVTRMDPMEEPIIEKDSAGPSSAIHIIPEGGGGTDCELEEFDNIVNESRSKTR